MGRLFNEWLKEWIEKVENIEPTSQRCQEIKKELRNRIRCIIEHTLNEELPNEIGDEEYNSEVGKLKTRQEELVKKGKEICDTINDLEAILKNNPDNKEKILKEIEKKKKRFEKCKNEYHRAKKREKEQKWVVKSRNTWYDFKFIEKDEEDFFNFMLRLDENGKYIIPLKTIKKMRWEDIEMDARIQILEFIHNLQSNNDRWQIGINGWRNVLFKMLYPIQYRIWNYAQEISYRMQFDYDEDEGWDNIERDNADLAELNKKKELLYTIEKDIKKICEKLLDKPQDESLSEIIKSFLLADDYRAKAEYWNRRDSQKAQDFLETANKMKEEATQKFGAFIDDQSKSDLI